ncbi:MAG TPA: hypothetical protein VKP30_30635 [Polyangiaceae bacterium]|nr:hypothetical protein [Polyangiaceae bacterium]
MALRTGHGTGAGVPRVEVLPVDELPEGTPAPAGADSRLAATERGKFTAGNRRSVLGGKATAGQCRLAKRLHLGESFSDPRFTYYARSAKVWRNAQLRQLSATVGGGFVGPGPSSVIASAALQLAASRFAFEVLGDLVLGSKLANDSRQNLLAAHELTAKEAAARPKRDPISTLEPAPYSFTLPPKATP